MLLLIFAVGAGGINRPVHLAAGDITAEELIALSRRRVDKPTYDTDTFLVVFVSEILPEDRQMLRSLLGEAAALEYVPDTAFIAHGRTSVLPALRQMDRVAVACVLPPRLRLSSSLSAHCSHRRAASLARRIGEGESELVVRLRPGASFDEAIERVRRSMGALADVSALAYAHLVVVVHEPARVCDAAELLSNADGVYMISMRSRVALHTWFATKVVQQGAQAYTSQLVPIWAHGINGRNMIVGVGDSGLDWDNCYISDSVPPQYNPPSRWLTKTHRKIVAYYYDGTGDDSDADEGHGTHVVGSIVGEYIKARTASTSGPAAQFDRFNGIAYKAKVVFTDIVSPLAGKIGVPENLSDTSQAKGGYYMRPYNAGARVHCDSWGSDANEYDVRAQSVDEFAYNYQVSTQRLVPLVPSVGIRAVGLGCGPMPRSALPHTRLHGAVHRTSCPYLRLVTMGKWATARSDRRALPRTRCVWARLRTFRRCSRRKESATGSRRCIGTGARSRCLGTCRSVRRRSGSRCT